MPSLKHEIPTGSRPPIWARRKRRLIGGLVLVVVAGGSGVAAATGTSSPAPATTTETVSTTTIRQTVSATGTLASANEANLSFAAAGQVTSVLVAAGDKVKATLAESVANALVSLASAQSRLSSDTTAGASAAQLTADQESLTVAQNSLTDAQQALAGATMTAPFAGTVAVVNLTPGEQVTGSGTSSGASTPSSSSGSGGSSGFGASGGSGSSAGSANSSNAASSSSSASTAQIVVIDPTHFTVSATVDDTEIGSIKPGLQAIITADSSTTPVYGTVSTVGLIASSTSGVTTYPVTIAVTGSQPALHDGSSVSVAIVVKQLTDVLAVPTTAVHYTGTKASVIRLVKGSKVSTPVALGQTSGFEVQVTKGLSAGDTITVPVTKRTGTTSGRTGSGTGTRSGFGGGTGFSGGGFSGGGFSGGSSFGGGLGG